MGVLSGETEEVQAEVVEAPKRKPFTIWEVDGKEYRLKLTTSEIVSLESKLRVNLLTIISSADDGSLPPLKVMLLITHGAMKSSNMESKKMMSSNYLINIVKRAELK